MGNDPQGRYIRQAEPRSDAGLASAARTESGTSTPFDTNGARQLDVALTISASAGTTPTLDLRLETTLNNGTTWHTVGSFPQKTGNGSDAKPFTGLGTRCRYAWTIAGTTPSFTFAATASAHR